MFRVLLWFQVVVTVGDIAAQCAERNCVVKSSVNATPTVAGVSPVSLNLSSSTSPSSSVSVTISGSGFGGNVTNVRVRFSPERWRGVMDNLTSNDNETFASSFDSGMLLRMANLGILKEGNGSRGMSSSMVHCNVSMVTDTELTCMLPLDRLQGGHFAVHVMVTPYGLAKHTANVNNKSHGIDVSFELSALNPPTASFLGGRNITITGFGFSSNPGMNKVKVGKKEADILSSTPNRIVFRLPSCLTSRDVPVSVQVRGVWSVNNLTFVYNRSVLPLITRVWPSRASLTPGMILNVEGVFGECNGSAPYHHYSVQNNNSDVKRNYVRPSNGPTGSGDFSGSGSGMGSGSGFPPSTERPSPSPPPPPPSHCKLFASLRDPNPPFVTVGKHRCHIVHIAPHSLRCRVLPKPQGASPPPPASHRYKSHSPMATVGGEAVRFVIPDIGHSLCGRILSNSTGNLTGAENNTQFSVNGSLATPCKEGTVECDGCLFMSLPAAVFSVSPRRGSTLGGTLLTITGRGFPTELDRLSVMLGADVRCDITVVTAEKIVCRTKERKVVHHISNCGTDAGECLYLSVLC